MKMAESGGIDLVSYIINFEGVLVRLRQFTMLKKIKKTDIT